MMNSPLQPSKTLRTTTLSKCTILAILLCSTSIHTIRAFTTGWCGSIPQKSNNVRQQNPIPFVGNSRGSSSLTQLFYGRRGRPKGPLRTQEVKPPMNDELEYDEMRVVTQGDPSKSKPGQTPKDEPLGVMTKSEALAKAKELGGLDLILINPNADPPVCKIVDYSKYRYMKEKKAKEVKKNSKASELKEVKMSYKIDVHDYGVRKKAVDKFIHQGNRVKLTVQFKGREVQHDQLGVDLLNQLAEDLTKICVMDGKPRREGRFLSCFVSPRPEILKAINDKKRAEEKAARKKKEAKRAMVVEEKEAKVAAASAAVAGAAAAAVALEEKLAEDDEDDDDDDSLNDLLGGDDLMDDLFA